MTAIDPAARPLPQISRLRYAADVRRGWHVTLPETGWALVLGVGIVGPGKGDVQITVRTGIHEELTEQMPRSTRLDTRTPEEQIQYIEARRLAQMPGRGLGPVSRLHFDEQVTHALAEILQERGR